MSENNAVTASKALVRATKKLESLNSKRADAVAKATQKAEQKFDKKVADATAAVEAARKGVLAAVQG